VTASVRVIGFGQAMRGDDAAALEVIARLHALADPQIEPMPGAADAAGALAQLEGASRVIAVDCARGGGSPGAILRLDAATLSVRGSVTSHGDALAGALALGAALGVLPPLTLFAIVGARFGLGDSFSAPVRAALPDLVACVRAEAL
jgi:hydrogenase maturation protease